MLCWRGKLCTLRNTKLNIVQGEGGNVSKKLEKLNSSAKCLNTFVAHCRLIGGFIYDIEVMFVLVACKFKILMSFWRNVMSELKYD